MGRIRYKSSEKKSFNGTGPNNDDKKIDEISGANQNLTKKFKKPRREGVDQRTDDSNNSDTDHKSDCDCNERRPTSGGENNGISTPTVDATSALDERKRAAQEEQKWLSLRQHAVETEHPMLRSRMHRLERLTVDNISDEESLSSEPSTSLGTSINTDDRSVTRLSRGSNLVRSLFWWSDRIDKSRQLKFNADNIKPIPPLDSLKPEFDEEITSKKGYRCSQSSSPPIGIFSRLGDFLNLNNLLRCDQTSSLVTDRSFVGSTGCRANSSDIRSHSTDKDFRESQITSHEWQHQRQERPSNYQMATGDRRKTTAIGQTTGRQQPDNTMPSGVNQYHYGTDGQRNVIFFSQGQDPGRSSRRSSNASRRARDPYGYTRLGQSHYQKPSQRTSVFQESKRFLLLLIIVAICGVMLWQVYEVLIDEETNYLGIVKQSPSILGEYKNYAVSTDAAPCAKVGRQLLAKGGHAIDAAIGTLICMGVVLPNSLGLGGGCLMTIYDNITKQATVIDGREQAPDYADETMFTSNPLSASRGPLSVGVPGELAAYWEAHQRFGRLPWADLFEDGIRIAEEGSPTVEHLSYALRDLTHAKYITEPLRKILWNNSTGDYVAENEILRQSALAETLRRIRDHGVDEFYKGPTGLNFIKDLQNQGGKMTMDNLSKYKALVKNASVIDLGPEMKVYTQPVPGAGIVLSVILRIMKRLGYYQNEKPKLSFDAAALYYHHLTEAFKFAYAKRAGLEDQPDDPKRMQALLEELESEQYIEQAVNKIQNQKTLPSQQYGGLQYFQEDHGTAHASVIDSEGNSVAVTTSINLYFGSGLVSPSTGIIYNDVMDDFVSPNITNKFNLLPSQFNRIRPGRRPVSSMAPSVYVDSNGNPRLIVGASGGSKITSAIALVTLRHLFLNDNIKTAIDGPRLHHQFLPNKLMFEANFPPEMLSSLSDRGHELQKIVGRSSVVMAVACDYLSNGTKNLITANSDYRKGGTVDGL